MTVTIKPSQWKTLAIAFGVGVLIQLIGYIVLSVFGIAGYLIYLGAVYAILVTIG